MGAKIGHMPKQTLEVQRKTLLIAEACGRYLMTGDVSQRDRLVKWPLKQSDEWQKSTFISLKENNIWSWRDMVLLQV